MCTAATYQTKGFYFGRTLDYDFSYQEEITITPRNFPLSFRHTDTLTHHYAIIGAAFVPEAYPLYYDAMNERGLCMAGLNFVGNASYHPIAHRKNNIAQFELIPWILGNCADVNQAKALLLNTNLTGEPFRSDLPAAQLHWMIADKTGAITVESVKDGLRIYDNPVGVLTNNPPFPEQILRLSQYMHLSPKDPDNNFAPGLPLQIFSRGMGAIGLPGDLSSPSRFVRAAFVKHNSRSESAEEASVSQFFHILESVAQPRGCCDLGDGKYEITLYTSCCSAARGIYYYTTYDNRQITAIDLHRENLNGQTLIRFPMLLHSHICHQN